MITVKEKMDIFKSMKKRAKITHVISGEEIVEITKKVYGKKYSLWLHEEKMHGDFEFVEIFPALDEDEQESFDDFMCDNLQQGFTVLIPILNDLCIKKVIPKGYYIINF